MYPAQQNGVSNRTQLAYSVNERIYRLVSEHTTSNERQEVRRMLRQQSYN